MSDPDLSGSPFETRDPRFDAITNPWQWFARNIGLKTSRV